MEHVSVEHVSVFVRPSVAINRYQQANGISLCTCAISAQGGRTSACIDGQRGMAANGPTKYMSWPGFVPLPQQHRGGGLGCHNHPITIYAILDSTCQRTSYTLMYCDGVVGTAVSYGRRKKGQRRQRRIEQQVNKHAAR